VMWSRNYPQKEIAAAIGKDKSVVSRELKRNRDRRDGSYKADLAQRKYEERIRSKPKHVRFTEEVRKRVDACLMDDYSPEQIAGRCRLEGVGCVSHERIYQYVWNDKKKGGDLHTHLRRKGRKYRKRGAAKDGRGVIRDRVSIDERPEVVESRSRFGDLEFDTIIGKNHKGAILTANDRATGLCWMALLEGKESQPLTEAAIKLLKPLKGQLKTITSDNGKEFANHAEIARKLHVDFYFAHPCHSWERGANENMNGLIRQYIPKSTSFEQLTENDIALIQNKLNNRPRKKLGFLTPIEFFYANFATNNELCTHHKVAFNT